jgi:hypothetical protein
MFTFVQLVSMLWYSIFPKKDPRKYCSLFYGGRCVSGDICGCLPTHKDPRKHCDVLKKEGCVHVDGFLCHVDSCDILKSYKKNGKAKVIPIKKR